MDQREYARFIRLEAKMRHMEEAMKTLITRLGMDPAEFLPQEMLQNPALNPAIREALLRGDKIKAIKLYREQYGGGLEEAKEAIDKML